VTDRRRNFLILLLVAGLLIASGVVIVQKDTVLGLDLEGGVELVYEANPTPQQPTVDSAALDRAIEVMRDRVDQLGVAEPEIQRSGDNQIAVGLPNVKNADDAQRQVGRVAQLFFYDWEPNVIGPDGRPDPTNPNVTGGPSAGSPAAAMTLYEAVNLASKRPEIEDGNNTTDRPVFYWVNEKTKKAAGPFDTRADAQDAPHKPDSELKAVQPGTTIVRAEQPDDIAESEKGDEWFVLADNVALRGTDIKNPEQNFDQGAGGSGQPIVTFEFTDKGRDTWEEVTKGIAQRGAAQQIPGTSPQEAAQHFAIVLDNELISTPFIDFVQNPNGIDGANGSQIEGGFTIQSAQDLSNLLKTGALPVKLELISQSQVSATLGEESLDKGLTAGIAGFAIVALFLLVFYRVLGLIAVAALLIYAAYFYALILLIPITLTLPGIAGLILTIGVAADANIVIFERVKEEIRGGRSTVAGIASGYRKGLSAIIDANVVTIMVAFILFVLATAGVKGFAFTLGVGTLVSLFTAVLATQAALGTLGRSKALQSRSALGASEQKRPIRLDFMGASRWFFSASGMILLICAFALAGKGVNFGIDFESGTRIKAAVAEQVDVDQIRGALADEGLADAEIQTVDNDPLGENVFQISSEQLTPTEANQVVESLDREFGVQGEPDTQSIGPTFGETVAKNAIIAIIASLLVITVYITLRFEWKYAVPILIALSHDILITAGVYALIGQEVTVSTVAAFLTILGFSLYDTIIVFDRIRENVPRMPRATFSQIVNRSLSEVIVRSLATSVCTLFPVAALLIGGGETLTDFALALLIGTASGTYSSIFIATPVLAHWKEREPTYRRRIRIVAEEHGGVVPAYAMAGPGDAPVDVAPPEKRRPGRRLTAPDEQQVSKAEFDDMVRDLHPDAPPSRTAVEDPEPGRPANGGGDGDATRDLDPSEVYMKDDASKRPKSRKPRNRKHGRNR
jgi:SecD/SecF fusion protein